MDGAMRHLPEPTILTFADLLLPDASSIAGLR
jgi:hypothetical protein